MRVFNYISTFSLIILVFTLSITLKAQSASQQSSHDTVIRVNPPFAGFYAKYLNSDGIPIRSASVVDNKALLIASGKIMRMLKHMPITRKNLIANGAELHIIGKDQQTSDLPEFRDQKGVEYMDNGVLTDIDKRTRGMGGLAASCGEENLLRLPTDRYAGGSDICVHEFAHTIMNFGLDNTIRQKIEAQRQHAITSGLWKGAYAITNSDEYWAELSMWYFGFHGEFVRGTNTPSPGPAGLLAYDMGGYKLLDSIYTGLIQPLSIDHKTSIVVAKGTPFGTSIVKARLTVINNQPGDLKLYWIDWQGNPKLHATVPAHGRVVQPTFISHVWMIENANGNALVYLQVNDLESELKLN